MEAIIIYSKTGHTLSVAEQLVSRKNMPLLRIIPQIDDPSIPHPILIQKPQINDYDHIIVGSPVHGFSLSKVMKAYLEQTDFQGKKVDLFVTHYFPYAWMGGNQTLKQMKKLIESKGGIVNMMTSINWSNKKRLSDIADMIHRYKA